MACRDLTRAETAAEEIRQATGNGNVVIRHLDLSSLYSVREFSKEFLQTEDRLDILINNAGTCLSLSPVSLTCLSPVCLSGVMMCPLTCLSHLSVSQE